MNWLNFFDNTTTTHTRHPFGRSINATISNEEEELFNKSQEAFSNKNILDAYEYFFHSLENFKDDDSNHNVTTRREEDELYFEIFQGTARVTGCVTQNNLHAEAIITKKSSANVALKRFILERNYQLTYANYYSDDQYVKIKLYHDNITMTPQKVFFPLREIALNADFDKEYIRTEFTDIPLEDIDHLEKLDEIELQTKYKYLHEWIDELNKTIENLPSNDNAGMQAFSLLNTMLMIDYLIVPKYAIYQKTSKKIQEYYGDENKSIESKNDELKEYINKLKKMSYEEFSENFYNAKYTFNPTEKTSKEEVDNFISESLLKIRWYKNNRYIQIIPTIYKYIAFNILYNYGLNPVIKDLLHTLVEIQNPKFFKSLEYQELYNEDEKTFSKKTIISKIEDIISPHQNRFKSLEPFGEDLNYSSLNEFSNSFYLQIQDLNFEEI
ncbi:hypothetical protein [Sulfurimonas sp.]